ncbi:hypothetical protein [Salmonella phage vB_Sal_PHB48]|nr:hypothetical protein [Salmonella phage vB_Sal_PHB48]
MRIHQVGGTGFLDIKKVILRGDLAQWHDFNAVRFSSGGVEKQVLKVAEPFRVAHRLA